MAVSTGPVSVAVTAADGRAVVVVPEEVVVVQRAPRIDFEAAPSRRPAALLSPLLSPFEARGRYPTARLIRRLNVRRKNEPEFLLQAGRGFRPEAPTAWGWHFSGEVDWITPRAEWPLRLAGVNM